MTSTHSGCQDKLFFVSVMQSSSSPCPPAPCLHSRTEALTPAPGFTDKQHMIQLSHNEYIPPFPHTPTLTVGVLWDASCCKSGKGVHWMGSTGQLQTDRSLAFPESNTPSPTLISLPLQPYWELRRIHMAWDYLHKCLLTYIKSLRYSLNWVNKGTV